jgi:hypothetical protein
MSFADYLREELVNSYGVPRELVFDKTINKALCMLRLGDYKYDKDIVDEWVDIEYIDHWTEFQDITISLRELLITHATRIRRRNNPDYWVDKFTDNLYDILSESSIEFIIVDDARYTNELNFPDQMIFWLENNANLTTSDITQDAICEWYSDNKDRTEYVETVIPLTEYDVQNILLNKVIPKINLAETYFEKLDISVNYEESDLNISS